MFDLSKSTINLNCPKCGKTNPIALGKVASQATINCRGCQTDISLEDKNSATRKGIQNANKAVRDFENAVKKLGR